MIKTSRRSKARFLIRTILIALLAFPTSAEAVASEGIKVGSPCFSRWYDARVGNSYLVCRPKGKALVWKRVSSTKGVSQVYLSEMLVPSIKLPSSVLAPSDVNGQYLGAMPTSNTVKTFVWLTAPLTSGAVAEPIVRDRYKALENLLKAKGWNPAGLLREPDEGDAIARSMRTIDDTSSYDLTEGFSRGQENLMLLVSASTSNEAYDNEVRLALGAKIAVSKYQPPPGLDKIVLPTSRLVSVTCKPAAGSSDRVDVEAQYELSGGAYEVHGAMYLDYRYDGPTKLEKVLSYADISSIGPNMPLVRPYIIVAFTVKGQTTRQLFTLTPGFSANMCHSH